MKLQISVVQVGQWTYIATVFVISVDSKSSNYNTTAHMGTVISLLRSSFKSCPILDRCLRLSQFDESLSASDKTKSYLSWDCVMLEFAQMSEIRDFSLCILRVHNLSDHERECGVVLRHHCVSFNILALDSVIRVSWKGSPSDSGTLCNLSHFLGLFVCCRNTAKKKRSTRCVWKALAPLPFWSLTLHFAFLLT